MINVLIEWLCASTNVLIEWLCASVDAEAEVINPFQNSYTCISAHLLSIRAVIDLASSSVDVS
jgi:hypothetical protein